MRNVCVCVLAVAVGCGKNRPDDRTGSEPEAPLPGSGDPGKGGSPNPKSPGPLEVDTAPDTSGFNTTDPKRALQWLAMKYELIENRARVGGRPAKDLHAELHRALVGKQVRWPVLLGVPNLKYGKVTVTSITHPESGIPAVAGGETYSLDILGRPSKSDWSDFGIPVKEPHDWIRTVRSGSRVLVVGTIKGIDRYDAPSSLTSADIVTRRWTNRRWNFDISPGGVEPYSADR